MNGLTRGGNTPNAWEVGKVSGPGLTPRLALHGIDEEMDG